MTWRGVESYWPERDYGRFHEVGPASSLAMSAEWVAIRGPARTLALLWFNFATDGYV